MLSDRWGLLTWNVDNKRRRIKGPLLCKSHFLVVFEPSKCFQPISEEKVPFGGGGLSLVSLLSLSVVWRHSLGALCDITNGSQAQLCWFLLQVGSGVASCGQLLAPPSVFWKVLIQLDKDFFTVKSVTVFPPSGGGSSCCDATKSPWRRKKRQSWAFVNETATEFCNKTKELNFLLDGSQGCLMLTRRVFVVVLSSCSIAFRSHCADCHSSMVTGRLTDETRSKNPECSLCSLRREQSQTS